MTIQAKTVLIAGDDSILASMLEDLRAVSPTVDVILVSKNPGGRPSPDGVREVALQDIAQLVDAARSSDLMLIGEDLSNYPGFALLSTLLDKPLMIYTAGERAQMRDACRVRLEQIEDAGRRSAGDESGVEREKPEDSPELLRALLDEREQAVQSLRLAVAEREARLQSQQVQIAAITSSRGWRLLQTLWRLRSQFVPSGSRRSKLLGLGGQALSGTVVGGAPPLDALGSVRERDNSPSAPEALRIPAAAPLPSTAAGLSRRVPIVTPTFFNFEGNDMYFGGAERYLIELARLIRELGYEPEVYQCANSSWVRYYGDLRVTGIEAGGSMQRLSKQFHKLVPEGVLNIYLAFFLAAPYCHPRSIGISHGIYWDHALYHTTEGSLQANLAEISLAFSNLAQVVSVDTNTINWTRGLWHSLARKFTYIPNFVDLDQFHPVKRRPMEAQSGRRLRILYPRRLYEPRGYWLVADLIPEFVERYPNVDFHFVGKAEDREKAAVQALMARYPGRVEWYFLPPERMPEAYQQADITLVPTVSSEGTSLSCLEALASGNAVVATNVGGLPDLVLSDHNGLLIEPTSASLHKALTRLIEDPALRRRLGRRGRAVARSFSMERWREQWRQMLAPHLPPVAAKSVARPARVALFPTAPGISWEPIKQRPHHLARQLAAHGIETFWGNPAGRQPSPMPYLHIIDPRDELYLEAPLVFIYYPFHFKELDKYENAFVVYDVLDDISIHDRSDAAAGLPVGERARDYHLKLLERADLVIASSRTLHEQLKMQRPDALLVPNGVDLEHFAKGTAQAKAITGFGRPVIGYHGAIAEWFDAKLLGEVAQQRPQYQFILIGPASPPELLAHLKRQPNVHYLGSVAYEQIPSYVAGFDVGILPFLLNRTTEGVRPLKVLEYLAMGKPAVATALPELADWPGVLCARTAPEFAAQLDLALERRAEAAQDQRISSFVASSDWAEVVQPLLQAIENHGVDTRKT